jgi:hypothetical protein
MAFSWVWVLVNGVGAGRPSTDRKTSGTIRSSPAERVVPRRDKRYEDIMNAPRIVSCLWFAQNAADGVRLYTEALPDARPVGAAGGEEIAR